MGERNERFVQVLELVRVDDSLPYGRGWRGRPRQVESTPKELRGLEQQLSIALERLTKVCDVGVGARQSGRGHAGDAERQSGR